MGKPTAAARRPGASTAAPGGHMVLPRQRMTTRILSGECIRTLPVLQLRNVSKSFGAIRALTEVNLTLEPGEVLGLMGDNGAGKSTLVKFMAGNFPPTHGEIRISGEPVHFHK